MEITNPIKHEMTIYSQHKKGQNERSFRSCSRAVDRVDALITTFNIHDEILLLTASPDTRSFDLGTTNTLCTDETLASPKRKNGWKALKGRQDNLDPS